MSRHAPANDSIQIPWQFDFPMKNLRHSMNFMRRLLCSGALLVLLPSGRAAEDTVVAAIASKVSDDYVRTKFGDGTFQPETYAFGPGGNWGGNMRDKTIDGSKFTDVAKVIAGPLARQSYLPTKDAKTTKLLIMVYWGTSNPPEPAQDSIVFQNAAAAMAALQAAKLTNRTVNSIQRARGTFQGPADEENAASAAIAALQAENALRRRLDVQNASMLGYDSWWSATAKFEGTPLATWRNDMIDELEEERYFVVLMAYDFQLLRKEKKHKLLWETRFSIRERGHEFDKELPAMANFASRYFGQDSHGLLRQPLPEGHVNLGELKVIGVVPEK